jgi:hypothetical protein
VTFTILRPNGIVGQIPALTLTGGGTVTTEVNDNSDSTYVKGNVDKGYARWFLDDITLTATQRARSVSVRIRNANDGGGGTTQDTLTNLNSSNGAHLGTAKFIGGLTSTRGTTTIATVPSTTPGSGPLCYSGPNGVAWTQAVINDLQIQVQWFKVHYGTAGWQKVFELYCDVDVNTQPSAGAVTVTNNVNNARPNIAFVYTQTEGYPQSRYRIKIFDSATYGTGNFNANTSTPVYDTGEISGDGTNFDLDRDLQQGVTYQAYVEAAMAWPGPQGAAWYSVWSVSAPFAITFTQPYTPTVTPTLLSDGQQYRTALAVTAPINLLTMDGASFEGGVDGWAADSNMAAVATNTVDSADGTHSLTLSSSASGNMVARGAIIQVDGGTAYTALVSFHAATAGRSCNAGIRWLDITGAAIGADVYGSNITDVTTAGVYTAATLVSSVAPGNAVSARILARVQATAAGAEIHRIDKVSLAIGSSTTWTPGTSTADHVLYLERGERVDRRRGPADNWAHPQVASGGSVLQDPGYGFKWDTTKDLVEWAPLDKVITGGGPYGMLHWQPRDPASSVTILRLGSWQYIPEVEWNFPVVAGSTHIGSFWAWVATGTLAVTPKIEWLNDDLTLNSTTTGGSPTLTTTPQQITVTGTGVGSGARLLLQNNTGLNTADIYVTRVGWGLGTTPVDSKPASGGPLVWTPIRFGETTAAKALFYAPQQGQTRTFNDFEMTASRPVMYRARMGIQLSGLSIISPNSAYQTLYTTPPTRTMLRSATDPTLACVVYRSEGQSVGGPTPTFSRIEDAAIFHPLGRDGGPVKVRDWVGGSDGELVAVTTSEQQAQRLSALVASSTVLQVQWARGGMSYILITGRSYDEDIYPTAWTDVDDTIVNPYLTYRVWSLPYVETTAP